MAMIEIERMFFDEEREGSRVPYGEATGFALLLADGRVKEQAYGQSIFWVTYESMDAYDNKK